MREPQRALRAREDLRQVRDEIELLPLLPPAFKRPAMPLSFRRTSLASPIAIRSCRGSRRQLSSVLCSPRPKKLSRVVTSGLLAPAVESGLPHTVRGGDALRAIDADDPRARSVGPRRLRASAIAHAEVEGPGGGPGITTSATGSVVWASGR